MADQNAQPLSEWAANACPISHVDHCRVFLSDRLLGLRVLTTPPQRPQANALCERLLGTLRRECVNFVIPLTQNHLRRLLSAWVQHYNHSRPHMSLGPGIPQSPVPFPVAPHTHRHRIPPSLRVVARPILGGLHHEYWLEAQAA